MHDGPRHLLQGDLLAPPQTPRQRLVAILLVLLLLLRMKILLLANVPSNKGLTVCVKDRM